MNSSTDLSLRHQSIALVLQRLAKRAQLSVNFSGSPSTDGKSVWLGFLDPQDPEFETLALGHGVHEILHVWLTDIPANSQIQDGKPISELTRLFFNVLEDVRIDSIGEKEFSSYRQWREALAQVLAKRGRLNAAKSMETEMPAMSLAIWLHAKLMADRHYQWARTYLPALQNHVHEHLDIDFCESIYALASQIDEVDSAQACLRLACKLEKLWQTFARNMLHSENSDKVQSRDALQTVGDLPNSPKKNHKKCSSNQCQFIAQIEALTKQSTHSKALEINQKDSTNRGLTQAAVIQPKAIPQAVVWPDDDTDDLQLKMDREEFRPLFESQRKLLSYWRDRFETLLQTTEPNARTSSTEGVEFDMHWVSHLIDGSGKLFEKNENTHQVDCEIIIILDRSGSMGLTCMTTAKLAVAALLSALETINGVHARLVLFPGPKRTPVALVAHPSEPLSSTIDRLAGIGAYGSTPIIEAMQWAIHTIGQSQATNRLILCITDGHFPNEFGQALQTQMDDLDIELALMTIEEENPNIARNSLCITREDDLFSALATLLARTSFCEVLTHR